jgi:hypothetical protein
MTKKKRILLVLSICLVAVVLLLAFGDRKTVNPFPIRRGEVERIELKTDTHTYEPGSKQVQLSRADINQIIRLINWSGYDPQIEGEPCCDTYWLEIYLTHGGMIRVSQGGRDTMIVHPLLGDRYWVRNDKLVAYVLELIDTHGLVRN